MSDDTREPRTLRRKRARNKLWLEADGRCQLCGGPLGDDWEADHPVPWHVRQRTNMHEMQALCRACNRRKGRHMLRHHQSELQSLARDIRSQTLMPHIVIAVVTAGAGKSVLPVILARELIPHYADRICWVCPRMTLQRQGERVFQDEWLRALV